ncbi:MAG TPA: hypothetical protein VK849_01785, partial [Longimicrobiales bacterium]|nr:hypothetical protein [Longimicrobiales bacterium]
MRPIVRAWLRVVSWLVPAAERGEWREEWGAELASGAGALRDAWGALPDAWYLGPGGWTMEGVRRDVGLAIRGLARKPFFSALAGLTLAMGIGANTAIFSVVDAVLLDPLPYPESDRVLSVNFTAPGMGVPLVPHSEGTYLHYLEGFRTMESFAVFTDDNLTLVSDASPERLRGARVTQGVL